MSSVLKKGEVGERLKMERKSSLYVQAMSIPTARMFSAIALWTFSLVRPRRCSSLGELER